MSRRKGGAPQVIKSCMFCGGRPLTWEHVFGDWLRQFVPIKGDRTTHEVIIGPLNRKVELRDLTGGMGTRKRKVVCGPCNNGWMSQLQTNAKPILSRLVIGDWPALSNEAMKHLAAWCAMTVMVEETMNPPTQVTPATQHSEFADSNVPPHGWQVWIGRSEGELDRQIWHMAIKLKKLYPSNEITEGPWMQMTTILIGKLVLLCTSTTYISAKIINDFVPSRMFTKIWPDNNQLSSIVHASRLENVSRFSVPRFTKQFEQLVTSHSTFLYEGEN